MDGKDAREYLEQVRKLDRDVKLRFEEVEYWKSVAENISGKGNDGMPHNPNRQACAPFVGALEKVTEIERDANEKLMKLMDLRKDILYRFELMNDQQEVLVLYYYYILNMDMTDIQDRMEISKSTAFQIRNDAFKHFPIPDSFGLNRTKSD